MTEKQKYNNFAALTVDITAVEAKTSKEGKPYVVAEGRVPMYNKDPMPLRVVATNGVGPQIKAGTAVLVGKLSYEEDRDGNGTALLFPGKVEFPKKDSGARRYVALTLRTGTDGMAHYGRTSGILWGTARAALWTGRDKYGANKPSLWMTVKAFAGKDGDESLAQRVIDLPKGKLINVCGHLDYEVYEGKPQFTLVASELELVDGSPTAEDEECPA
jgi:hypothetical protein